MILKFTKMHGCANDYIYLSCFGQEVPHPEKLSIVLSDRHRSIGGDGIVLICPSAVADAKMRMFNIDGSEGKMCGNAIRCVGKFLYDKGIIQKTEINIETLSGIKHLKLHVMNKKVDLVTVDMGKAELLPERIPVVYNGNRIVDEPIIVNGEIYHITCISMGNPHCVVFCNNPDEIQLETVGRQFEQLSIFPDRVNTEFISVIDSTTLKMRVWERGSGETLACGTGACAAVVAAVLNGYCSKDTDITVRLKGGDLTIKYTDEIVYMTGDAHIAFEGEVTV